MQLTQNPKTKMILLLKKYEEKMDIYENWNPKRQEEHQSKIL